MAPNLVVVEKLNKQFNHDGNTVHVLRDVDLTIEQGEMLCVMGASGAGKSTLLHMLGTLDVPSSGRIFFRDHDVTQYNAAQLAAFRNHAIGFVFQFHHLLPEFSAIENVMMPGLIRAADRVELRARAQRLLDEVGLNHRISHRPGELSGGEQQRVALARALVMEPMLVLADEPTGNLDTKTSEAIHNLFYELNQTRGTTLLVVTHSRDLAESMPRVVTMKDGRLHHDLRREVLAPTASQSQAPEGPTATSPDSTDAKQEAPAQPQENTVAEGMAPAEHGAPVIPEGKDPSP